MMCSMDTKGYLGRILFDFQYGGQLAFSFPLWLEDEEGRPLVPTRAKNILNRNLCWRIALQ